MHRILSEVSRHMEQQHMAHRNLDKMRAENELAAREDGDRKVDLSFQTMAIWKTFWENGIFPDTKWGPQKK